MIIRRGVLIFALMKFVFCYKCKVLSGISRNYPLYFVASVNNFALS